MKKLLCLFSIGLVIIPNSTIVSCGGYVIPHWKKRELTESISSKYFWTFNCKNNFISFIYGFNSGVSSKKYYNNSFKFNFVIKVVFEDPSNTKLLWSQLHYITFAEHPSEIQNDTFKFKMAVYDSKVKKKENYKLVEEIVFETKIVYDILTELTKNYIREKKIFAKDIVDSDIKMISIK